MSNPSDAAPERKKAATRVGEAVRDGPTAEEVAGFLRRHPTFLFENPDLLNGQHPPQRDHGSGVVDLQHIMVNRLRAEVKTLRDLQNELVETGRSNRATQERVHRAVLALLEARSFETFVERVITDLAVILNVDLVTLCVEHAEAACPAHPAPGIYCLEKGTIAEIFGPGGCMVLHEKVAGDPAIFGAGAGIVSSQALLRLNIGGAAPDALLAIGCREEGYFNASQGTELLGFVARVLENCFRGWLNLASP
jgi:uncharacterized protein YigA (DUF484 family)